MTASTKRTRRTVLAGIAGSAVAPAALPSSHASAIVPGPNDRRLLDLERTLVPYRAWCDDPTRPIMPEAEEAQHYESIFELQDTIAETPADSVIGLMVKVRQFRYHLDESLEDALPYHHNWHLRAVVCDIERLAGEVRHV